MKIKRPDILYSELLRNTTKLLSANVVAQVVGLLIYPILTRMYSQDDFGLASLFISMGTILAIVGTAEYQYAVVLPKEERLAVGAWQAGCLCLLLVTGLVTLSIPFAPQIAGLLKAPELATWYWAIPLFLFFTGLWALLNYWYGRHKQFGRIGAFQVLQTLIGAGTKTGVGAAGFLHGGLVVSSVVSLFAALASSVLSSLKQLRPLRRIDAESVREAARTFKNFPCFSLPRALVNNVSGNLDVWMIAPAFGLECVGVFGMAIMLSIRPINIICSSLYQVLFQRTSERVQERTSIRRMFWHLLTKAALVGGLAFTALYFVLPALCEWLLGEGWRETGELIQLLLPWVYFSLLVAPINFLTDVFGKQKIGLVFEVLLFVARVVGISLGIWQEDFHLAVLGYSVGSALVLGAKLTWFVSLIRRYEQSLTEVG